MVLGLIGASMMISKVGFIRRLAVAYSTVIRGVPDLGVDVVDLLWRSNFDQRLGGSFGGRHAGELNPFMAGVLTLSVIFGAYFQKHFAGRFWRYLWATRSGTCVWHESLAKYLNASPFRC